MVNGGQLSEGFERFSVRGKRMRLGEGCTVTISKYNEFYTGK